MTDRSFLNNITTIIFDMDGVIFDSEALYIGCCRDVCAENGIVFNEEVAIKCLGATVERTKQLINEAYGEEFDSDWFWDTSFKLFMERYGEGRLPMKPGVEELLKFLKENGYKIALASSTVEWAVRQELTDAGIIGYFDRIVCGDMVKRSKPFPDIFLKAAELLDSDQESCIVIEDSFNGIRAAHAAGMHPVMVPDIIQPDDEIRSLTDIVAGSLHEVREILFKAISSGDGSSMNLVG